MAKSKKGSKSAPETNPKVALKDLNSLAREEFVKLIDADTSLSSQWKETITPLISEKIPDDLSSLQELIDGVPYAPVEKS